MKLTSALLRSMELGNNVLITESRNGTIKGQGDVTYLFSRLKPKRFVTKRLLLVDPEGMVVQKVIKITRVE